MPPGLGLGLGFRGLLFSDMSCHWSRAGSQPRSCNSTATDSSRTHTRSRTGTRTGRVTVVNSASTRVISRVLVQETPTSRGLVVFLILERGIMIVLVLVLPFEAARLCNNVHLIGELGTRWRQLYSRGRRQSRHQDWCLAGFINYKLCLSLGVLMNKTHRR